MSREACKTFSYTASMAGCSLSKLVDAGSQAAPSDVEVRRLFHPTKTRVEKVSLRPSVPR